MLKINPNFFVAPLMLLLLMGCAESEQQVEAVSVYDSSEWLILFDGSSFEHWRGYRQEGMAAGWEIVGDAMTISTPAGEGDIITKRQFSDFELEFEWMVPQGGNSGVMFRVVEDPEAAPYASGPEYQVLDDAYHTNGQTTKNSAASNYDIHPPSENVVHPFGEWNSGRIVANGPHVEHWLNGVKVVEYELWNDQWKADVAASKWKNYPNYGLQTSGYIALQGDHTSVSYRNIRIREL